MELEQELNKRRAAPTDFWIQLVLLTIATIIAFFLLNNSRQTQRKTEKKIAYSISERSTNSKIELYGKNKI
jgi:hypothetical protein